MASARQKIRKPRPAKPGGAYAQLWRVVDGCVADTLNCHPDYVAPKRRMAARISLNKRIVGAVLGFAEQSAKGSGVVPGTDTGVGDNHLTPIGRCTQAALARAVVAARAAFSRWRRRHG